MSTYLIDYENVSFRGLLGLSELSREDSVYLFYTENANQVSLDMLNRMQAKLYVIRVAPGKQSLDMHLASWLGNLIGKEAAPDEHYVIISNDTDFDGVISFWRNEFQDEQKILRRDAINPDDDVVLQEQSTPPKIDRYERIRLEIQNIFRKHSEKDENGKSRIRISVLCSRLNHLPAYQSAKKSSGKKAHEFLSEKFSDEILLFRQDKTEWVYLVSEVDPVDLNKAENVAEAANETLPESEQVEPEENPNSDTPESTEAISTAEENNQTDTEKSCSDTQNSTAVVSEKEIDIIQKLVGAGFEPELSDFIEPIIAECMKARSPKTMLCKQLRHVYGSKIGNEYYKTIRDTLKM